MLFLPKEKIMQQRWKVSNSTEGLCSGILQTNLIKRILYWDVLPLLFQGFLSVHVDIGIAMGQASIALTVYSSKSQMWHSPRRRLLKIKVQRLHTPQHCPTA